MSKEKETSAAAEQAMAEKFDMVYNYTQALEHYQKAFDLVDEGVHGAVDTSCCLMLKIAHFAALDADYNRAIMNFKYVIRRNLIGDPTYHDLSMLMVKLALCYIAKDDVDGYESYVVSCSHPMIDDAHYKFISKVIGAYKKKSLSDYTDAVLEFDRIFRFEPWIMTIILRIRLVFD